RVASGAEVALARGGVDRGQGVLLARVERTPAGAERSVHLMIGHGIREGGEVGRRRGDHALDAEVLTDLVGDRLEQVLLTPVRDVVHFEFTLETARLGEQSLGALRVELAELAADAGGVTGHA